MIINYYKYIKYKYKYEQLKNNYNYNYKILLGGSGKSYETIHNNGSREGYINSCMWISIHDYVKLVHNPDITLQEIRQIGKVDRVYIYDMYDSNINAHVNSLDNICNHYHININIYTIDLNTKKLLLSDVAPMSRLVKPTGFTHTIHILHFGLHYELIYRSEQLKYVLPVRFKDNLKQRPSDTIYQSLEALPTPPLSSMQPKAQPSDYQQQALHHLQPLQKHQGLSEPEQYIDSDTLVYNADTQDYINITYLERQFKYYNELYKIFLHKIDSYKTITDSTHEIQVRPKIERYIFNLSQTFNNIIENKKMQVKATQIIVNSANTAITNSLKQDKFLIFLISELYAFIKVLIKERVKIFKTQTYKNTITHILSIIEQINRFEIISIKDIQSTEKIELTKFNDTELLKLIKTLYTYSQLLYNNKVKIIKERLSITDNSEYKEYLSILQNAIFILNIIKFNS